jgi:hypothetical protein
MINFTNNIIFQKEEENEKEEEEEEKEKKICFIQLYKTSILLQNMSKKKIVFIQISFYLYLLLKYPHT